MTKFLSGREARQGAQLFVSVAACLFLASCTVGTPPSAAFSGAADLTQHSLGPAGLRKAPSVRLTQDDASESSSAPVSSFQVSLARRQLDAYWEPVDELFAIGFAYSYEEPDSLGFELGFQYARDSATAFSPLIGSSIAIDLDSIEFNAGLRKTFARDAPIQPFVGAGVTFIQAQLAGEGLGVSVSDNDSSLGLYLHGGLMIPFGDRFRIGLDLRIVRGTEGELFGAEGDMDYEQFGVLFDWTF